MADVADLIKDSVPVTISLISYESIVSDARSLISREDQSTFNDELNTFNQRLYNGYYGVSIKGDALQRIITHLSSFKIGAIPKSSQTRLPNQCSFDLEYDLVNELQFAFLGSNSASFTFKQTETGTFKMVINMDINTLQFNQIGLLYEFIEVALILKTLKNSITKSNHESATRIAFNTYLKQVFNQYTSYMNSVFNKTEEKLSRIGFLKLKSILNNWPVKLKFLLWLSQRCVSLPSHEFLNLLSTYSSHGDATIGEIAKRALEISSVPFSNLVKSWILLGKLEQSTTDQFFISKSEVIKFHYDKDIVPTFLLQLSAKIFQIGETLNYINTILKDYQWCEKFNSKFALICDPSNVQMIEEMFNEVVTKLNESILTEYLLEVANLNKFLLLKQGDFINSLITKGCEVLNIPSDNLTTHKLIQLLQDSIESTSIRYNYPPQVYNRLDARLLNIDSHGFTGWKLFTLDYHLNENIDVLIGNEHKEYLRVFNFLIQMKRIEYQLSNSWVQSNKLKRIQKNKFQSHLFIKFNILRHQFLSFIHNIYQFISNEIIDKSYDEFKSKFESRNDLIISNNKIVESQSLFTLDNFQKWHHSYIQSISRCELFSSKSIIPILLREIIEIIDLFCLMGVQFDKSLRQLYSSGTSEELESLIDKRLLGLFKRLNIEVVEKFEDKLNHLIYEMKSINLNTLAMLLII